MPEDLLSRPLVDSASLRLPAFHLENKAVRPSRHSTCRETLTIHMRSGTYARSSTSAHPQERLRTCACAHVHATCVNTICDGTQQTRAARSGALYAHTREQRHLCLHAHALKHKCNHTLTQTWHSHARMQVHRSVCHFGLKCSRGGACGTFLSPKTHPPPTKKSHSLSQFVVSGRTPG